ncbi:DUF4157 domain-containing protein [Undibacterium sp. Ji50W]|uniref:eCIS core domain-containing protein n=1 Tax=Undibacterium sp. Ji50W TaxID=3413041 RepID=UPI003BF36E19
MKSSLPAQRESLQPVVSGHVTDSKAQRPVQPAGFIDQRPAMLAHIQRQQLADRSPQARQLQAISAIMNRQPVPVLQRVEEELQGKFQTAQRREEDELVQAKVQDEAATLASGMVAARNDTGLPNQLKAGVESLSGISLDAVKVHYNSAQPAQLIAHAYAQGTEIHIGPGQEKHLPHEAWHVVQQAQGRVRPTMQIKAGVAINDDSGLESEADVMGTRALALGGGNKAPSRAKAGNAPLSNTSARQFNMHANLPVQLTRKDAAKYVFDKRVEFYKIEEIANSLFEGWKVDGKLQTKLTVDGKLVFLKNYIEDQVNKDWVKKWVADTSLLPNLRKGLLVAWNEGLTEKTDIKEETEKRDEKEEKTNKESEPLPDILIADLIKNVSTLKVDKDRKLQRSDSFSFENKSSVSIPKEWLEKMDEKICIESANNKEEKEKTGKKYKQETVPCTTSLYLAGMYIRAYGDKLNEGLRSASAKFVLNLGGTLGVYRDTKRNGDLFYFPLKKKKDEEDVYMQEGGSTEHTWDELAKSLSEDGELDGIHKKLAEALTGKYEGKLNKSDVIAIGAMLSDAKYSIQGWLYAVEKLKEYKFVGKDISELFAITGNPFWKYSLNKDNPLNRGKDRKEKGRQAGLGYKKLDLESQKKLEKKGEKEDNKEEEITSFEFKSEETEKEFPDMGKREGLSLDFKFPYSGKSDQESFLSGSDDINDKKRNFNKAELEEKKEKDQVLEKRGKPNNPNDDQDVKFENGEEILQDEDFDENQDNFEDDEDVEFSEKN